MQNTVPDPCVPLKVVVAYEDVPAGHRAVGLLKELLQGLVDDVELQPVLWRFDLLRDLHWHKMAVTDAAHADMLVLSTSGSSELPDAVSRWLEAGAALKHGDGTALVVLRGAEEAWAISIGDVFTGRLVQGMKPAAGAADPLPAGENLLVESA